MKKNSAMLGAVVALVVGLAGGWLSKEQEPPSPPPSPQTQVAPEPSLGEPGPEMVHMGLRVGVKTEKDQPANGRQVVVDGDAFGYTDALGNWVGSVSGRAGNEVEVRVEDRTQRVVLGSQGRELSFVVASPPAAPPPREKPDEELAPVPPPPPPPPKSGFRITIKDDAGRPLSGVLVKMDGGKAGTSSKAGVVDGKFPQANAEYRFTFEKEGYYFADRELPVSPQSDLTEREVILDPLHFLATFIDSLSRQTVFDIEVFYEGTRLLTTTGGQDKVAIPRLGTHSFELRCSPDLPYISPQQRQVNVNQNAQEINIYVLPKPRKFQLRFTRSGRPVADKEVNISGSGYRDQGRTDKDGRIQFSNYNIREGEEYKVELVEGGGKSPFTVHATGYSNPYDFEVRAECRLRVSTQAGQESASLSLYRIKSDFVQNKPPLHTGTGALEATVAYGEYFLVAKGEGVTVTKPVTCNRPEVSVSLDLVDPFVKAEKLREEGKEDEAIEYYKQVAKDHPKYSEAMKRVGFYYNKKGEFSDAVRYFDEAIAAPHGSDPYLYLAAAQANHREKKYLTGIEYARKAFTYRNLFAANEREAKRVMVEYTQVLCRHDWHFDSNRSLASTEKCAEAQKLLQNWESFLSNAEGQNIRDAGQRKSQVETELINSDCQ